MKVGNTKAAEARGLITAVKLLEAAPTVDAVPQWIPVTERLPKIYRDKYEELIPFLVCVKGTDYPFRAVFDGKNWGDGWYRIDVIAWMPLPKPYKMDGKDGDGDGV